MTGKGLLIYIGLIALVQFTVIALVSILKEGDSSVIAIYMVVFWLPAIIYHGFSGLPALFGRSNWKKTLCYLAIPCMVCLIVNEVIDSKLEALFRIVIAVSFLTNCAFFIGLKRWFYNEAYKSNTTLNTYIKLES
jgi:hypothetical protein